MRIVKNPSVHLVRQRRIFLKRKSTRLLVLLLGLVIIPIWQFSFYLNRDALDTKYEMLRGQIGGASLEHRFLYFYYYLGLFPVAAEDLPRQYDKDALRPPKPRVPNLEYSKEGAEKFMAEHGDGLIMEIQRIIRNGELGIMFLYLPYAYYRGSPKYISMVPTNAVAFTLALILLYVSFWWINLPLLGTLTVAFIGSNPFQLFEIYRHEDVFSWPITTAVIILALHLPLVTRKRPKPFLLWTVPLISGLFLGTIYTIRPEPVTIIVSALACYLTLSQTRWRVRFSSCAIVLLSFLLTSFAWNMYFDHKFEDAARIVKAAGGHPYTGPRAQHHMFWHPVWCGLSDFGGKYGYVWHDTRAYAYAYPIMEKKYKGQMPKWNKHSFFFNEEFWDESKRYYKNMEDLPLYTEVIRDKVIHDITHDPLWYVQVLWKRTVRLLTAATPARLAFGSRRVTLLPNRLYPSLLIALTAMVVLLLFAYKEWTLLKIATFPIPLAFTALFIYSGSRTTYYSSFHLIMLAIASSWAVELSLGQLKGRWGRP